MKIVRIKLKNLRNEEWFNFYTEFKTFVEQSTPGALNIEALFAVFLTLYGLADALLEVLRKSGFTAEIFHLDGVRDSTFRGLVESIKSSLHHYLTAKRKSAEKLELLIDHYGNMSAKSYNEETSSIYNLLQDMRGKYADDVIVLALSGWLDRLEADNKAFEEAVLARNAEAAAGITDLKLIEIRRQTDRCYQDIMERIEALMLISNTPELTEFVKTLNTNIERYKSVLNRRGHHPEPQKD